jgi:DNA replication protein DnaC
MKATLKSTLLETLKELHLPTVRSCYEEEAARCRRESLSYEEYLFDVMSAEREDRRERRIARLVRESRLPLEKNLESY